MGSGPRCRFAGAPHVVVTHGPEEEQVSKISWLTVLTYFKLAAQPRKVGYLLNRIFANCNGHVGRRTGSLATTGRPSGLRGHAAIRISSHSHPQAGLCGVESIETMACLATRAGVLTRYPYSIFLSLSGVFLRLFRTFEQNVKHVVEVMLWHAQAGGNGFQQFALLRHHFPVGRHSFQQVID